MSEFSSAEAQRLYYLNALGITSYYPRYLLPGARPSEPCPWPEPAAMPETSRPTAPAQARGEAAAPARGSAGAKVSRLAGLLDETPDSRPSPPAAAKAAAGRMEPETHIAGEALQFQMCLLPAANKLAVCVQLPALARQGLSKAEARLLGNILHWLGSPLPAEGPERRFSWPLPGVNAASPLLAGGSFYGFLEQAYKEMGYTHLLLMGSSGPECLAAYLEQQARTCHWRTCTTLGLMEMLNLPALKRSVYEQLLPLHAELARAE